MKSLLSCIAPLGFLVISFACAPLLAQPNDDFRMRIGYYDLLAEYGTIEDGTGIGVSVVEADANRNDDLIYSYMPDQSIPALSVKTIIDGSGLHNSTPSLHATTQTRIVAADIGIGYGVDPITMYEAIDYIERVLGFSSGTDPLSQPFQVQNHSWVANFDEEAEALNALRRFDYMIERDGISMSVGVLNGSQPHADVWVHSYNAISVGRTDGQHAQNPTTINGAGRTKPDIVSSGNTSSAATSEVSSVLSVLHEKAVNEGNPDASRPETMKAILMGGATKTHLPGWDRTMKRPIDEVFGAGEVNLYNSYKILEAGETDGSTDVPDGASIDLAGYDYGEVIDANESLFYNFEVTGDLELRDMSILLTWNLEVTDGNLDPLLFDPVAQPLADMSLHLYDSTGAPLELLLDSSLSPVDNVEHIFVASLDAGLYTIEVTTDRQTDFGLAWYGRAVPEPTSAVFCGLLGLVSMTRLRRTRLG